MEEVGVRDAGLVCCLNSPARNPKSRRYIMLDLIDAVVLMSSVLINLAAFTHYLAGTLARRLVLAGVTGAWLGLAVGLGGAGRLAFSPQQPIPLIGVLLAV